MEILIFGMAFQSLARLRNYKKRSNSSDENKDIVVYRLYLLLCILFFPLFCKVTKSFVIYWRLQDLRLLDQT